jgi:hypothetical protein
MQFDIIIFFYLLKYGASIVQILRIVDIGIDFAFKDYRKKNITGNIVFQHLEQCFLKLAT